MSRKKSKRPWLDQCCYHVSNTCYDPARIFRHAYLRKQAVTRLRELKKKYPIRFLDYLIHPNGYRLLVEARHPGEITEALRSFHVGTTHDFCQRHEWQGPVWRQRGVNIVLVEKGAQALRCALDMDFEMVRSGDSNLFHPLLWDYSGHLELCEVRKRYRLLDRNTIRRCFMDAPWLTFREWYIAASTTRWNSGEVGPEPWWQTALVVGSRQLCETIADTLPTSWLELKVFPALQSVDGLKDDMAWTVGMSRKRRQEYIRSLVPDASLLRQARVAGRMNRGKPIVDPATREVIGCEIEPLADPAC